MTYLITVISYNVNSFGMNYDGKLKSVKMVLKELKIPVWAVRFRPSALAKSRGYG